MALAKSFSCWEGSVEPGQAWLTVSSRHDRQLCWVLSCDRAYLCSTTRASLMKRLPAVRTALQSAVTGLILLSQLFDIQD